MKDEKRDPDSHGFFRRTFGMMLPLGLVPRAKYPRPPLATRLEGPRVILRMPSPEDFESWARLRGFSRDFLQPWEPEWPRDMLTYAHFCGQARVHWREWQMGTGYAFHVFLKQPVTDAMTPETLPDDGIFQDMTTAGRDEAEGLAPPERMLDAQRAQTNLRRAPLFPSQGHKNNQLDDAAPEEETNLTLIGAIGLNDIRRGIVQAGEFGYWIGMPYAGRGYMTEALSLVIDFAFRNLRLHRVEAACLPENIASRRLLARAGFRQEGYARSYRTINGTWRDHLLWGRVG